MNREDTQKRQKTQKGIRMELRMYEDQGTYSL